MKKTIYILLLIFIASCSSVSNYPIDLSYRPKIPTESIGNGTVTVTLFNDKRAAIEKEFIGVKDDGARFITLRGEPASRVSSAVGKYLESRGYTVANGNEAWDGTLQSLKPEWGEMVLGGDIEDLAITVKTGFPETKYLCLVKLNIIMADPKTRTILHQERVEASSSYVTIYFSREKAEELINETLADAMEKSLKGMGKYFPKK